MEGNRSDQGWKESKMERVEDDRLTYVPRGRIKYGCGVICRTLIVGGIGLHGVEKQ